MGRGQPRQLSRPQKKGAFTEPCVHRRKKLSTNYDCLTPRDQTLKRRQRGYSRAAGGEPLGRETTQAARLKTRWPSRQIVHGRGSKSAQQRFNRHSHCSAQAIQSLNIIDKEAITQECLMWRRNSTATFFRISQNRIFWTERSPAARLQLLLYFVQ